MKNFKKYIGTGLIFLLGVFTFLSCNEDKEMPNYSFKFETKIEQDKKITYVNEVKKITYVIESEYLFDKVGMKFKVSSNKKGKFILGDDTLEIGKEYAITKNTGTLKYIGLENDVHKLSFEFENEHKEKRKNDIEVNFSKRDFDVEVEGDFEDLVQGTENEYILKIITDNFDKDKYEIKFDSYDEKDLELKKTKITFNDKGVKFNKWYDVLKINKLLLKTDYIGAKKLKYTIRNSSNQRKFIIQQNIGKSDFEMNLMSKPSETFYQGEQVTHTYKIENETIESEYKIKFDSNDSNLKLFLNGTEISLNKEVKIPSKNNIKISFISKLSGTLTIPYKLTNDFGVQKDGELTQTFKKRKFTISVKEYSNNIYQGMDNQYDFSINNRNTYESESYYFRIVEYDNNIKSYVKINGANAEKMEEDGDEMAEEQSWVSIKKYNNKLILNSFNSGSKTLEFEIKNDFGTIEKKSIKQEVLKQEIKLEKFDITGNFIIGGKGQINLKFITTPYKLLKSIKYRVWASESGAISFEDEKNVDETEITDQESKWFSTDLVKNKKDLNLKFLNAKNVKFNIQFMDEFGNESEIFSKNINVDYDSGVVIKTDDYNWEYKIINDGKNSKYYIDDYFKNKIKFSLNKGYTIKKVIYKYYFKNGFILEHPESDKKRQGVSGMIVDFYTTISNDFFSYNLNIYQYGHRYSPNEPIDVKNILKTTLTVVSKYKDGTEKVDTFTKRYK